jgi:hypothetical protein
MQRQADATIVMMGIQIDPKEEEKIDGNKKGSRYNWSSLCWGKKHGDMVP